MKKLILISFAAVTLLTGCAKKNAHYYAKKQGLDFGFAVTSADILQEPNMTIVKENATMVVSENNMKNVNIHPSKKFWNWSDTDHLSGRHHSLQPPPHGGTRGLRQRHQPH